MAHDASRNEDGPLTKTDPGVGGRHAQKHGCVNLGPASRPGHGAGGLRPGRPTCDHRAEAHAIGVDAYVYFYPLVTMDVTRKQFTNFEPGKVPGRGPMNMFNNVPTFPPADDRGVVRPNFDTLYSIRPIWT